jgi:hypothetical protein
MLVGVFLLTSEFKESRNDASIEYSIFIDAIAGKDIQLNEAVKESSSESSGFF